MKQPMRYPTMFDWLVATVISTFKNVRADTAQAPQKVGNYQLIRAVAKDHKRQRFGLGVYEKDKRKYFIKTWEGRVKDASYLELIQEYKVGILLHDSFEQLVRAGKIKTHLTKPIELIGSKKKVSLVFDYIADEMPGEVSSAERAKAMTQVLIDLVLVTKYMPEDVAKQLPHLRLWHYVWTLPLVYFHGLVTKPQYLVELTISLLKCFKNLFKIEHVPYVLAHRDLAPLHVRQFKGRYFLCDNGYMAYTILGYDLAYLSAILRYKPIYAKVSTTTKYTGNYFLKNYLIIKNPDEAISKKRIGKILYRAKEKQGLLLRKKFRTPAYIKS